MKKGKFKSLADKGTIGGGFRQKAEEEFALDAFGSTQTPMGPGKVPLGKTSKTAGKVRPSRVAGKTKGTTPVTLRIARKRG